MLASALRAGHSLVGALSVMARDAHMPSKREFERVVADEQLGVPADDSLRAGRCADGEHGYEPGRAHRAPAERNGLEQCRRCTHQVAAANIRGWMHVRRLVRTLTAQGGWRGGSSR